jgi:hypothetical protein
VHDPLQCAHQVVAQLFLWKKLTVDGVVVDRQIRYEIPPALREFRRAIAPVEFANFLAH